MATNDSIGLCNSEEELKLRIKHLASTPGNIDSAATSVYENLIEDVILGIVFEIHQMNRIGEIPVMTEEEMKPYAIIEKNETDIFSQQYVKKSQDCYCPSCNRPMSASRFAPHLEKCLGMGRNSSRIASRRIANNCKENAYGGISDDDDDDWVAGQEKSKVNKKVEGKKKRDKNGVRKNKTQKMIVEKSNGTKTQEDYSNQNTKYENTDPKT